MLPAFINDGSVDTNIIFKEIVGPKKKYINYERFLRAYLKYKSNDPSISPSLKTFFDKLLKETMKKNGDPIGNPKSNGCTLTTTRTGGKYTTITDLEVLTQDDGDI